MSGWGGQAGRKLGCGRPLQFVVPSAPAPAPAVADDDDVWGEDLSEGALEEAIMLESQVLAPALPADPVPPPETHVWEELDIEEEAPAEPAAAPPVAALPNGAVSAGAGDVAAGAGAARRSGLSVQPPADLERLLRENATLTEQLQAVKTERYTHQGEVSVLRSELAKRAQELETLRLDQQHHLQEQRTQFDTTQASLAREVDALKSELQFKAHELAETSRQCRELRSPQAALGSPPRKMARLGASPELRKRFINRSDFGKSEVPAVAKETTATQTEKIAEERLDCSEVAPSQLASAVLAAGGGADWLPAPALTALAELSRQSVAGADQLRAAAALLVQAATPQLQQLLTAAQQLQAAADRDSRSCTLSSGRLWWAALLRLLRQQRRAAAALAALTRLSEWPGLASQLLSHADLTELLPRLLRPLTVQGVVRNPLMLEYSATLLASLSAHPLPDTLLATLEPVMHEVLNTKPPPRVLYALLELLSCAAGSDQAAALWCHTAGSGTCLLRKLGILFSEGPASDAAELPVSYSLPVTRRPRTAAAPAPAAALRGELRPPELLQWTETMAPALERPRPPQQPWLRLVWLLVCREEALPSLPCCRANLSVLVVLLLYSLVSEFESGDVDGDSWAVGALVSALHQLSDMDAAFSASVSRVRHQYLAAMDALARCWRQLRLSPQTVGVLQELYKFEPGTFDAETAES